MSGTRLADVPLDAPVPTSRALSVWYQPGGYWCSWSDYVWLSVRGAKPVERAGDPVEQPELFG